jgi:hypothetical protein
MNSALEKWTETFYSCLTTPLKEEKVYDMVEKYISTLKLNGFSGLKRMFENEKDFKKELDILSCNNEPEFELLSKILGESEFTNGLVQIDLFGLNLLEFNFNVDNLNLKIIGSDSSISDNNTQLLDVH